MTKALSDSIDQKAFDRMIKTAVSPIRKVDIVRITFSNLETKERINKRLRNQFYMSRQIRQGKL